MLSVNVMVEEKIERERLKCVIKSQRFWIHLQQTLCAALKLLKEIMCAQTVHLHMSYLKVIWFVCTANYEQSGEKKERNSLDLRSVLGVFAFNSHDVICHMLNPFAACLCVCVFRVRVGWVYVKCHYSWSSSQFTKSVFVASLNHQNAPQCSLNMQKINKNPNKYKRSTAAVCRYTSTAQFSIFCVPCVWFGSFSAMSPKNESFCL